MQTLAQDLSFALRSLRRRRAFATVAIVTAALGIGAATSIFSVVDGVLFRPLPYREPDRILAVWQTFPKWRGDPILDKSWDRITLSIPEYRDWRDAQRSFLDVAIWSTRGGVTLGNSKTPEVVSLMRASAAMLRVLGVAPVLGRYFSASEDQVGGTPVTMVTHEAWESRYERNPGIVGRTVHFDDRAYTVIGVLPPALSLYRINTTTAQPPFWVPAGQEVQDANNRRNHSYQAIGRLRPGVTLAQATQETERILRGEQPPEELGVRLEEWQVDQTRTVRQPLMVLLAAVGLLLVASCVNVAILLLGEAASREQEIAARMALGARRGRIVRQLLTESLLLSAVGGVAGSALAWGGTRALVALAPPRIPGLADVTMDVRVLAFALAVAIGTGILFGLAPAVGLSRSALGAVFRSGGGQSAAGRGRLQQVLIATEIALSVVLLVGASLLARSLDRMTAVDPGFRADHLLTVRVSLPRTKYTDSTLVREYYRAAIERLSALPGVAGVTATSNLPFGGGNSSTSLEIEGKPAGPGAPLREAEQRTVQPGYFEVMEVPILAGRGFGPADRTGGSLSVIVSRTLAEREWPGASPIGRQVKFQGVWREVVGVVGDTRFGKLSTDPLAMIYAPTTQRPWFSQTFLVRTSLEPLSMTDAVRKALHELDPAVPFLGADTMQELIRRSSVEERYRTTLVGLFGIMAGILAAVGMYGVATRAASRRTREVGIRIALGARSGGVVRLIMRSALNGVLAGIVVGVLGAVFAGRWLAPFLFGIAPDDRLSFALSAGLLAGVSLLASWLPARRAARVPPAIVLRTE
jgi:predicted permease